MTELIPEERISECTVEEITDVPNPRSSMEGSYEKREGDKDCRRCYPSRQKPTTLVLDRRGVFGSTCQYKLSSAAAVQQCSR